jgi:hypothetical protein
MNPSRPIRIDSNSILFSGVTYDFEEDSEMILRIAIRYIVLALLAGCGSRDSLDPTIDSGSIGKIQVSLMKAPEVQDFLPIKLVSTKDAPEQWKVTLVKLNDVKKRASFEIDKKDGKVRRVEE